MRVRKKLRRIKRLAYLGILIGCVIALRKAKAARDARNVLGPPATWPPLVPGEAPVAAVGDLAADPAAPAGPATPVTVRTAAEDPAPGVAATEEAAAAPEVSDVPVAAVGVLAAEDPSRWVEPDEGACPLSHR
jgi:hypothetical protein